jgi:hypothetical protein
MSFKLFVAHMGQTNTDHDVFKSDVMSLALTVLFMARLKEEAGFNNPETGPLKIRREVAKLCYTKNFQNVLLLMLRFDETERPSFYEVFQLVLQELCLRFSKNTV